MYVNKYKIRLPHLSGTSELNISVPFSQTPWLLDQTDIIDTKFVDIEVEDAVNQIFDYENVRFVPIVNNTPCDIIKYNINMLDNGVYPPNTYWSDVDFTLNDFIFKKNSGKSFI